MCLKVLTGRRIKNSDSVPMKRVDRFGRIDNGGSIETNRQKKKRIA
jgi:hypothetical protein